MRAFTAVAARHADTALVLAGPEGWGEDELQRALDASLVRGRIARTGWVEPHELAALPRGADVLAYPSRYEGFGFPPLQAMRAGIPVVATAVGSLPEVLGDGALMVEPGDQDGLAGALAGCLDDEGLRARLIAAGESWVRRFSWARCGAELEQLYRDTRARCLNRLAQCCSRWSSCGAGSPAASGRTPGGCCPGSKHRPPRNSASQ